MPPSRRPYGREHIDDTLIVRIARGEVDPDTGLAVQAEVTVTSTPTLTPSAKRNNSNLRRRSMSQPAFKTGSNRCSATAAMKSFTMPVTPCAAGTQKGRNGVQALPHPVGKHHGPIDGALRIGGGTTMAPRKSCTTDGGGGGGEALMEMFERARSKTAAAILGNENATPTSPSTSPSASASADQNIQDDPQDVSDIVLACLPEQQQHRGCNNDDADAAAAGGVVGDRNDPSPDLSTVFANPFARKQTPAATRTPDVIFDSSSFLTPAVVSAGGVHSQSNSKAANSISRNVLGAGIDAWSRLGQGRPSVRAGGGTPQGCQGSNANQAAEVAEAIQASQADRTFTVQSIGQPDNSAGGKSDQIEHASSPPPITPGRESSRCSILDVAEVRRPTLSSSNRSKRPLPNVSIVQGQGVAHGVKKAGSQGAKKARQGAGRRGVLRPSEVASRKDTRTMLSFFGPAVATPNASL